ncbi:MAG: hypothetical protein WC596_04795, partial [Candidatus Shapirobacteria bacterium]
KEYFSVVSRLPSIQAGGGTGLILIEQRKSGILSLREISRRDDPQTPFLFARLLGLRPQNFRTDGFCGGD